MFNLFELTLIQEQIIKGIVQKFSYPITVMEPVF